MLKGAEIVELGERFRVTLMAAKAASTPASGWYPYDSLSNIYHLAPLFDPFPLDELVAPGDEILDLGAADGDFGFFFESLGYHVTIIDNPPTNFNGFDGAALLKESLRSSATLKVIDLDSQFALDGHYRLSIFLGILYHLKNPFFVLERLAAHCDHLLLSTRVFQETPNGVNVEAETLAYLVDSYETNADPTNFWMMTPAALELLARRSGWEVLARNRVGATSRSNPRDDDMDERMFLLLRSTRVT